jgi:site-specific recombinase
MKNILENIKAERQSHHPKHLIALVNIIRPKHPSNANHAIAQINNLIAFMYAYPDLQSSFQQYLSSLFVHYDPLMLYTNSGILSNKGFFSETFEKISFKILPPLTNEGELVFLLNQIFYKKTDYRWVDAVPSTLWIELFQSIGFLQDKTTLSSLSNQRNLLNTALVLAQRVTAIGLEPVMVAKLPYIDNFDSAFLYLSREVNLYVDNFKENPLYYLENEATYQKILKYIADCEFTIYYLRKNKDIYGVSLSLTYLLLRLSQHLQRLKVIFAILQRTDYEHSNQSVIMLLKELVHSENRKYSLRKHFSDNLSFLAFKVVEHTSKTGEHYIATNRKEYAKLLKYACGGGLVVAFLCLLKLSAYNQHFPPFGEAFFYSMNYSIGFIIIHLLHFILATKQPAMTASTIASSLDSEQMSDSFVNPVILIAQIVRSQFISLVGNAMAAFPVAYGLAWAYFYIFGKHIVDSTKASLLVSELHPWDSLALPHAAIAGFFLMTSGLLSGFYDNKVVYDNIPQRLKKQPLLQFLFPKSSLEKLSDYIGQNLGALAGNFYLGIFLGITSTIGKILGLALDIRHITFATGNFALALVCLNHEITLAQVIYTLLGIVMIGIVNVLVSFGLSMGIALKSRNVNFANTHRFFIRILRYFFRQPLAFFFPIKERKELVDDNQMFIPLK